MGRGVEEEGVVEYIRPGEAHQGEEIDPHRYRPLAFGYQREAAGHHHAHAGEQDQVALAGSAAIGDGRLAVALATPSWKVLTVTSLPALQYFLKKSGKKPASTVVAKAELAQS
jgi:hypothetical protein